MCHERLGRACATFSALRGCLRSSDGQSDGRGAAGVGGFPPSSTSGGESSGGAAFRRCSRRSRFRAAFSAFLRSRSRLRTEGLTFRPIRVSTCMVDSVRARFRGRPHPERPDDSARTSQRAIHTRPAVRASRRSQATKTGLHGPPAHMLIRKNVSHLCCQSEMSEPEQARTQKGQGQIPLVERW